MKIINILSIFFFVNLVMLNASEPSIQEHVTGRGTVLSIVREKFIMFKIECPQRLEIVEFIDLDELEERGGPGGWEFPLDCKRALSPDLQKFVFDIKNVSTGAKCIGLSDPSDTIVMSFPSTFDHTELDPNILIWEANPDLTELYCMCKAKNNNNGYLARIELTRPLKEGASNTGFTARFNGIFSTRTASGIAPLLKRKLSEAS